MELVNILEKIPSHCEIALLTQETKGLGTSRWEMIKAAILMKDSEKSVGARQVPS